MNVAKNAPCPCGSGLKYKRCHMPREDAAKMQPIPWLKILGVVVLSLGVGITVGYFKEPPVGVAATFATAMVAVCWTWLYKPPGSVRGRESSASINFGHQAEKTPKTRNQRPTGPSAPSRRKGKKR